MSQAEFYLKPNPRVQVKSKRTLKKICIAGAPLAALVYLIYLTVATCAVIEFTQ